MMKFLSAMSLIAFIFYLYVGITTYKLNKKSKECKIFLLLNISMAIWSLTYSFAYTAENIFVFSFWNKFSAIGWCLFPALSLYLVLTISESKIANNLFMIIMIFIPGIIFLSMSVFLFGPNIKTNDLVSSFFYIGDFIYDFSYLLLSIFVMYIWGKKSQHINPKKQSRIIVIASITPFLLNLITQYIFPLFGAPFIPNMGQLYSLIMLWGVYYTIINYQFMHIPNSLITNELFNEIIDLTFLIDLDGNILRINKQVTDLLLYDEKELIYTPITNIIKGTLLNKLVSSYSLINQTIKLNDINISSKIGDLIPFNLSIIPLRDLKKQRQLGILIIGQDIRFIKTLKDEIISHNITSEKLKTSEELFRTMVEIMPFALTLTSVKNNSILYINTKTEELFKTKKFETIGKPVTDYFSNPEHRSLIIQDINQGKSILDREIEYKRKDNSIFCGLLTMVKTVYNDQEVLLSCVTDITEQKILQQSISKSEKMLRNLMDAIPDLVSVSDLKGNITFLNKSIFNLLGYTLEDKSIPNNISSIISKKDIVKATSNMKKMLTEEIGPVEYREIKKDGTIIDVEVNGTVLRDESNEPFSMVFVTRDITERKRIQENLKKSKEEIEKINNELLEINTILHGKSIRDGLTNLYNHQYINELLELEIDKANNFNSSICILMLDIDFFKRVNDNFGHQIGDKVLVTLSNLIQLNAREIDLVGRYGGEEFIVVLPDITLDAAYQIADKIRLGIQHFDFEYLDLIVTISIGLTAYNSGSAKSLINKADTLLYQAKNNGRNRIESVLEK